MKKTKFLLKTLFVAVFAISAVSCDDDDNNVAAQPTIAAVVNSNPNFSSLKAALDRAGLTSVLNGAGPFTVFAPDNDAFDDFLTDNGFANLQAVPEDLLRNTLLNHVITGSVASTALTNGYVKTNATNSTGDFLDLYVDIRAGVVLNGGPEVSSADNAALNGIIHVVDEVIALPTITTLAVANPNFSNLSAALGQQSLVATVSSAGPFTVFAPLNSSFQALIDADPNDGLNSIADILALPNLTAVLTYHVAPGAVRAASITNGLVVNTANTGTSFTINTTNGVRITDANGRITNVVVTDVTATNGVVHAIDNVLLP